MKITVLTSLYRCSKYLNGYFEHVRKLKGTSDIEILLLHNAPTSEELELIERNISDLPFVKHIIITERESLYITWNRGIRLSQGAYLCVWNVDDIRFPDSLNLQAATLDQHPDILLTYGDFYYMYRYPEISENFVTNEDFSLNAKSFFTSHQIGCFPMWRKSIHDSLGYFDEQFFLVADFDFQFRLARTGKVMKTEGLLGGYLEDVPEKLSSNMKKQLVERNTIYLRYAVFELLNWFIIPLCMHFKIFSVKNGKEWMSISSVFERYSSFYSSRLPLLFVSVIRQPRYFLSFVKHCILNK